MHPDNPHAISQAGLDLIAEHEGRKLQAYLCPSNRLTIGVGHVLLPKADWHLFRHCDASRLARLIRECQSRRKVIEEARTLLTINHEQCDELLQRDVAQTGLFLRSVLQVRVSQAQFDALVSFVFNVGQGAYATSTLRKKLEAGDTSGAAAEFGRWIKGRDAQGKKITLPGLVKRRAAERKLFEGLL